MSELLQNTNFDGTTWKCVVNDRTHDDELTAASPWVSRNNPESAVTATVILPSTRPDRPSAGNMLHVCTAQPDSGVLQTFATQPPGGLPNVEASAYVYVVRGQVGIGSGQAGSTGDRDAVSDPAKDGHWQLIGPARNQGGNADEFAIYAISPGGACYYVDSPSVTPA